MTVYLWQKLYAVTDVALMVLQEEQSRIQRMQRKTALASILPEKLLKQMMLEPRLPAKLFLVQDKVGNLKTCFHIQICMCLSEEFLVKELV